jgi:hypothetical protein
MSAFDDAALIELLDLGFDAVCARTAADFVDPARVLLALDRASEGGRVEQWLQRLAVPMRARLLERASQSALKLGDWLPGDVTFALADLLGAPAPIPRKMIDEFVASDQVRDTVRTMLQESLSSFVSKATSSGGGGGTGLGLRDALGWGARAAAAAGKGLLGGLGGELQKQLQERVRDFVDGSMAMVQGRIAEKLASADTARALGAQRRRAFLALLDKTEADAAKSVKRLPHGQLDALVPKVVAHNAARAEVREALESEMRAVLEVLSQQRIGELLDQAGLRDAAREALHAHGLPVARALVGSSAFQAWWERAVGARGPQGAT